MCKSFLYIIYVMLSLPRIAKNCQELKFCKDMSKNRIYILGKICTFTFFLYFYWFNYNADIIMIKIISLTHCLDFISCDTIRI